MQAIEIAHAPVAQLDRVTDYESVGQGFESLLAYQNRSLRGSVLFCFSGLEHSNATRMSVAREGLTERLLSETSPSWRAIFPASADSTQYGGCGLVG